MSNDVIKIFTEIKFKCKFEEEKTIRYVSITASLGTACIKCFKLFGSHF